MSYNVVWTLEAEDTFDSNLEYLQNDWNQQVIIDFLDRVNEILDLIEGNPKLYPLHKKSKTIRRCVVTEQITLFYELVNDSTIELKTFWNNYQNPKRLKL